MVALEGLTLKGIIITLLFEGILVLFSSLLKKIANGEDIRTCFNRYIGLMTVLAAIICGILVTEQIIKGQDMAVNRILEVFYRGGLLLVATSFIVTLFALSRKQSTKQNNWMTFFKAVSVIITVMIALFYLYCYLNFTKVPNVCGLSMEQARQTVQEHELLFEKKDDGIVESQSPSAYSIVRPQTVVVCYGGKQPAPTSSTQPMNTPDSSVMPSCTDGGVNPSPSTSIAQSPQLKSDALYDLVNYSDASKENYTKPMVFGSDCARDQVITITFFDDQIKAQKDAWDISDAGDRSVLAWTTANGEMFDLYIAGKGKVCAPKDSQLLFAYYKNLRFINFNNCFDTASAIKMNGMFEGCENLVSLDVVSFDTSNVTSMAEMFMNCFELTMLNLKGFNTYKVQDMSNMFYGCSKLQNVQLSDDFAVRSDTDINDLDVDCPNPILITVQRSSLAKGSKGEDVYRMQLALIKKNYLFDVADGDFGDNTVAAVKELQRKNEIDITGIADRETLNALAEDDGIEFVPQGEANLILYDISLNDADGYSPQAYFKNVGSQTITSLTYKVMQCTSDRKALGNLFGQPNASTRFAVNTRILPGETWSELLTIGEGAQITDEDRVGGKVVYFEDAGLLRISLSAYRTADGKRHNITKLKYFYVPIQ